MESYTDAYKLIVGSQVNRGLTLEKAFDNTATKLAEEIRKTAKNIEEIARQGEEQTPANVERLGRLIVERVSLWAQRQAVEELRASGWTPAPP